MGKWEEKSKRELISVSESCSDAIFLMVSEGISVFLNTLESILTFSESPVPEGLSSGWCSSSRWPHGEGWKCVLSSCVSTNFTSGLHGLVTSKAWLVISGDTIWWHSLLQFVVSPFATGLEMDKHCRLFLPILWCNEKASTVGSKCFSTQTSYISYKNWVQGTRKFHKC